MKSNINWELVPYFKMSEFNDPKYPNSGSYINGSLLIQLVKLRQNTFTMNIDKGWPILIHSAVDIDGKHHSKNSLHNLDQGCLACDFHFDTDASIREQLFQILKIGFGGIGIYYWWNNVGFHIDIRPKSKFQIWVSKEKGKYIYLLR